MVKGRGKSAHFVFSGKANRDLTMAEFVHIFQADSLLISSHVRIKQETSVGQ